MTKKAKKVAGRPSQVQSPGSPSVSEKVTIKISRQLLEILDAEVERIGRMRPKFRPSRAGVIKDCLRRMILEPSEARWNHPEARESLQQEGNLMEAEADMLKGSGEQPAARSLYLQAAAKELEALAVLDDPDEGTILSSLFRIVLMTQKGTGYHCLPTIPGGPFGKIVR